MVRRCSNGTTSTAFSALSEKVFSLLNSSFKYQQERSLQDYVKPLLCYNTANVNNVCVVIIQGLQDHLNY